MLQQTSIISDHDPPKLKCPLSRVKEAEPGKLTAMVSWERPTATDTADRSLQYVCLITYPNLKLWSDKLKTFIFAGFYEMDQNPVQNSVRGSM